MRDASPKFQPPFGDLLRTFRRQAGLSQEVLAERAGLSVRGISDLERGRRTHPYPATVATPAAALESSAGSRERLQRAARPDPRQVAALQPAGMAAGSAPLDAFIGRDLELARLTDWLIGSRHRLVTVLGPGGVGKTRAGAGGDGLAQRPGLLMAPSSSTWRCCEIPPCLLLDVSAALGVRERAGQGAGAARPSTCTRGRCCSCSITWNISCQQHPMSCHYWPLATVCRCWSPAGRPCGCAASVSFRWPRYRSRTRRSPALRSAHRPWRSSWRAGRRSDQTLRRRPKTSP